MTTTKKQKGKRGHSATGREGRAGATPARHAREGRPRGEVAPESTSRAELAEEARADAPEPARPDNDVDEPTTTVHVEGDQGAEPDPLSVVQAAAEPTADEPAPAAPAEALAETEARAEPDADELAPASGEQPAARAEPEAAAPPAAKLREVRREEIKALTTDAMVALYVERRGGKPSSLRTRPELTWSILKLETEAGLVLPGDGTRPAPAPRAGRPGKDPKAAAVARLAGALGGVKAALSALAALGVAVAGVDHAVGALEGLAVAVKARVADLAAAQPEAGPAARTDVAHVEGAPA